MKKIIAIMLGCLFVLYVTVATAGTADAQTTTFKDVKANTETGKAIYSMVEKVC